MYERYFGLTKSPFSMTPDPDSLFLTGSHREALAGLSYAIVQRKGFAVLEGEAGTGKTTLLRRVLQMLPEVQAQTSVFLNPVLTPDEFFELLLAHLGVEDVPGSKAQRLLRLERWLNEIHRDGKVAVLVIDEAHKLDRAVLEEIRMLSNFETNDSKLLQIVLTGQPELREILNRPDLRQLKQRIAVRLNVQPLAADEVRSYIEYRWGMAGAQSGIPFGPEAISLIARYSKGVPRLINSICDSALLIAFGERTQEVNASFIAEAARDLDLISGAGETPNFTPPPPPAAPNPSNKTIQPVGNVPLKLEALERYMPAQSKSFFGFRFRRQMRTLSLTPSDDKA